jgi:hypothetical protein
MHAWTFALKVSALDFELHWLSLESDPGYQNDASPVSSSQEALPIISDTRPSSGSSSTNRCDLRR